MADSFVGCRVVEFADEQGGLPVPMLILYPTDTPGKAEAFGPYSLDVARDAAPQEGNYPLVLISHGSGGSPLLYRTLAHHLAGHGYVVGLPEHPRNNRQDNALAHTAAILVDRPRQLRLALDWFYGSPIFAPVLQPDTVAVVGHSLGGYSGLALAGGVPTTVPRETPDGQPRQLAVAHDDRVKALVLLAPASPWFRAEGALREVDIPIQLWCGAEDHITAPEPHARFILDGVHDRARVDYRLVPNAGHYSFMSPYPAGMVSPSFPPSQDPPGFDRAAFHATLNAEVLAFLDREL